MPNGEAKKDEFPTGMVVGVVGIGVMAGVFAYLYTNPSALDKLFPPPTPKNGYTPPPDYIPPIIDGGVVPPVTPSAYQGKFSGVVVQSDNVTPIADMDIKIWAVSEGQKAGVDVPRYLGKTDQYGKFSFDLPFNPDTPYTLYEAALSKECYQKWDVPISLNKNNNHQLSKTLVTPTTIVKKSYALGGSVGMTGDLIIPLAGGASGNGVKPKSIKLNIGEVYFHTQSKGAIKFYVYPYGGGQRLWVNGVEYDSTVGVQRYVGERVITLTDFDYITGIAFESSPKDVVFTKGKIEIEYCTR